MPFDKVQYDTKYNRENVTRKFIPFNKNNPDDAEMLEHLATVGNVTQYIKRLIREDMRKTANAVVWNMDKYPVGYVDEEAIAAAEDHTLRCIDAGGNVQIWFDVDEKKILRVDRLS